MNIAVWLHIRTGWPMIGGQPLKWPALYNGVSHHSCGTWGGWRRATAIQRSASCWATGRIFSETWVPYWDLAKTKVIHVHDTIYCSIYDVDYVFFVTNIYAFLNPLVWSFLSENWSIITDLILIISMLEHTTAQDSIHTDRLTVTSGPVTILFNASPPLQLLGGEKTKIKINDDNPTVAQGQ